MFRHIRPYTKENNINKRELMLTCNFKITMLSFCFTDTEMGFRWKLRDASIAFFFHFTYLHNIQYYKSIYKLFYEN